MLLEAVVVNALLQDPTFEMLQALDPQGTMLVLETIAGNSPLQQCIDAAKETCGEGNVCWVCVSAGDEEPQVYQQSCAFACRDGNGDCTIPIPPGCFGNATE